MISFTTDAHPTVRQRLTSALAGVALAYTLTSIWKLAERRAQGTSLKYTVTLSRDDESEVVAEIEIDNLTSGMGPAVSEMLASAMVKAHYAAHGPDQPSVDVEHRHRADPRSDTRRVAEETRRIMETTGEGPVRATVNHLTDARSGEQVDQLLVGMSALTESVKKMIEHHATLAERVAAVEGRNPRVDMGPITKLISSLSNRLTEVRDAMREVALSQARVVGRLDSLTGVTSKVEDEPEAPAPARGRDDAKFEVAPDFDGPAEGGPVAGTPDPRFAGA